MFVSLFHCSSNKRTYEQMIREELKIQHVFPIPSNSWVPGSIVHYHPDYGYQRACNPWDVLKISEEEYNRLLKDSNALNVNLKTKSVLATDLDFTKEEIAELGSEYSGIKSINFILANGKIVEYMGSLGKIITDATRPNNSCAIEIYAIKQSHPDARFFIIGTLYAYDFNYEVITSGKSKTNVKLSPKATQIIATKLNMKTSTNSELSFSGEKMYIGFNGLKRNITQEQLAVVAKANNLSTLQSMLGGDENEPISALDITEIVRDVKPSKKK